jgi:lipopolysaccharide export system permease protein
MMKRLDRYILRYELGAFLATIILIVALLSLENAPRLWSGVSNTATPVPLLLKMMWALLPEYIGIGVIIAGFIAPAWAFRSLALRGEWQVLASFGLSPLRIMVMPMLLACLSTGVQLAIRMNLEPLGERVLDEISLQIRSGNFGAQFPIGNFIALDPTTTVYFSPPCDEGQKACSVFIRKGENTFTARTATASRDSHGRVEITLLNGQEITRQIGGSYSVLNFLRYDFTFAPKGAKDPRLPLSEQFDRMSADQLARIAATEAAEVRSHRPAAAALMARLSYALFGMLLPWWAFALAVPPQRQRGGAALMLGIGAIVLFLRTSYWVEAKVSGQPWSNASLHMALWAAATLALVRFVANRDQGVIDQEINRLADRLLRRGSRLRRIERANFTGLLRLERKNYARAAVS